jgi:hypothetical protein
METAQPNIANNNILNNANKKASFFAQKAIRKPIQNCQDFKILSYPKRVLNF